MNEILPGIKVLKLYAWELPFMDRVNAVRAGEIDILKYLAKLWALTNFTFACSPFLVTVVVFTLYTTIDPVNHVLDASKIFVSMSLFGLMRLPLTIFPWALTESIKLFVSLKRINKFLNAEVSVLKFIYSEKATKFCEIFTLLLSYVGPVKSKVKILQNFVAFSEYMNFMLSQKISA